MNFILDKDDFYIDHVHFSEVKHNIIIDGNFTKLFYCGPYYVLNNIFIDMEIVPKDIRQIHSSYYMDGNNNNKYIMYFDLNENIETLQKIVEIEKNILDYYLKYRGVQKIPEYIFKNQIMNKNLKFYKQNHQKTYHYQQEDYQQLQYNQHKFYLKISGIWENNMQIGITYKIVNYS
jgi:hypothetical protein